MPTSAHITSTALARFITTCTYMTQKTQMIIKMKINSTKKVSRLQPQQHRCTQTTILVDRTHTVQTMRGMTTIIISNTNNNTSRPRNVAVRKMVPTYIFWCLWKEKNDRTFEDKERSLEDILSLFYSTLYSWTAVVIFPLSLSFSDFLVRFIHSS